MSKYLEIGDHVSTEYSGRKTMHSIVGRSQTSETKTGVSYRVMPSLNEGWLDSSWFTYVTGMRPDLWRDEAKESGEEE